MNSVSMAKTFSLIHFLQNFFNVVLSVIIFTLSILLSYFEFTEVFT